MLAELLSSGLVIPQAYPSHCDLEVNLLVHVDLLPWCVLERRVAAARILIYIDKHSIRYVYGRVYGDQGRSMGTKQSKHR